MNKYANTSHKVVKINMRENSDFEESTHYIRSFIIIMVPRASLLKSSFLSMEAETNMTYLIKQIYLFCDFLRHAGVTQGTFWTGISATIFWLPLGYELEM